MSTQCMQVTEILMHICEELRQTESWVTLAALASTSSATSQPALDSLWKEQDAVAPLVLTFPQCEVVQQKHELRSLVRRFISQASWDRSQTYARRVRVLRLGPASHWSLGDDGLGVTAETLKVLMLRAGGSPVYPNLQELDLHDMDANLQSFIPMFVGPALTKLRLRPSAYLEYLFMMGSLPSRCPQLATFEAAWDIFYADASEWQTNYPGLEYSHQTRQVDEQNREVQNAIRDLYRGWPSLVSVSIPDADPELLRYLGQHPNLRHLSMGVMYSHDWKPATHPSFTRLRSITILHASHSEVLRILMSLSAPPLAVKSVFLSCTPSADDGHRQRNLDTIAQICDASTLQSVSYFERSIGPSYLPVQSVPPACLLQYRRFANMTEFAIGDCLIDVTDNDMATLATAWPRLLALRLHVWPSTSQSVGESKLTLSVLLPFAQNCPSLTALVLLLDATNIPPPPSPPVNGRPTNHTPLQLDIISSPVEDVDAAAHFICAVFHDRVTITVDDGVEHLGRRSPTLQKWAEIREKVVEICKARALMGQ
ncbi:hypothetical protein EV714DRAFT_214429 [Schizophyllum commune]